MSEKKEWDLWEKRIALEARLRGEFLAQNRAEVRIVRNRGQLIPIRLKSNVDFSMGLSGKAAFFDAKVCNDSVWNLKKYCFNEKKIHQFAQVLEAQKKGNIGGYLIWFVAHKKIVWAPAEVIAGLRAAGVASLSPLTPLVSVQDESDVIDFRKLMGVGDG